MRYKRLANTEMQVSVLGFGGIPIQRVSLQQAIDVLAACSQRGINFIDTARAYTDSEEKIGAYFNKFGREQWYVATKSPALDYQGMWKDIETSLNKLNCQYIDLYQLHNVATPENMERVLAAQGATQALEEAQQQGLVRHIGITGHKPEVLEPGIDSGRFQTLQIPYNALEKQALPLLKKAKQLGMGTIGMKPLAGGALHPVAAALEHILDSRYVDTIIPGMDSVDQVVENCAVLDEPVSLQQRQELEALVASLGHNFCRRCEYCMPCPEGLKIPAMFLFEGYYTRYNLKDWALERYATLPVKASQCTQCAICESRCPYELPIRQMLRHTAEILEKK